MKYSKDLIFMQLEELVNWRSFCPPALVPPKMGNLSAIVRSTRQDQSGYLASLNRKLLREGVAFPGQPGTQTIPALHEAN